jgi:hypothetical protein
MFPKEMGCLRNVCADTLHKGDIDDDDDNNNNHNNNNNNHNNNNNNDDDDNNNNHVAIFRDTKYRGEILKSKKMKL